MATSFGRGSDHFSLPRPPPGGQGSLACPHRTIRHRHPDARLSVPARDLRPCAAVRAGSSLEERTARGQVSMPTRMTPSGAIAHVVAACPPELIGAATTRHAPRILDDLAA